MTRRVGLALARASEILGAEPYFHELIAGVERVLTPEGVSFLLKVVPTPEAAAATIRRWIERQLVDAIVLIDLLPGDPRVELARSLGAPTVVVGDPDTGSGFTTVWAEDDVAMQEAVAAVAALGHVRVGHVTGPESLAHTGIRSSAFRDAASARGLDVVEVAGDYSQHSGVEAVAALLALSDPPTAIITDNDLMALGAIEAAAARGVVVPRDLSILAWDDSALCQLASPPLSAMSHDVQGIGALVGASLLEVLDGAPARVVIAPRAVPLLRGSTGPKKTLT